MTTITLTIRIPLTPASLAALASSALFGYAVGLAAPVMGGM